jgi:hypothetical protein
MILAVYGTFFAFVLEDKSKQKSCNQSKKDTLSSIERHDFFCTCIPPDYHYQTLQSQKYLKYRKSWQPAIYGLTAPPPNKHTTKYTSIGKHSQDYPQRIPLKWNDPVDITIRKKRVNSHTSKD